MPNNNGTTGLPTIHSSREEEYRAFDTLPQGVKEALRNANCKFSAVACLAFYRKHGTRATIAQTEKMSFKAYCNSFPGAAMALIDLTISSPRRLSP